jgi:hypothetical protein
MDVDPTPQTEARVQHKTEFMRRQAIQDAKEAQPMDSQVARDARQAIDRRVTEANTSLKAAVAGEMNVSLLMMIKKWMDNRCVFCMVFHFDRSAGHTLENCPREPGLNKHLDNFIKDGDKLSASRSSCNLPADYSTCYFCYWPGASKGLHEGRPGNNICPQRDQVIQLVWLLQFECDAWTALKEYFNLGDEQWGRSYFRWAWTANESVAYDDGRKARGRLSMMNQWRVIMWYVCRYRQRSFD